MHRNLTIAWLAIASLAVVSKADVAKETEELDATLDGYDHHLIARNALEGEAAAIKAEFGDDVDVSLEGYAHLLFARGEAEDVEADLGGNVDVSLEGYDDSILEARSDADDENVDENELATQHAQALADVDEDYDQLPDGMDPAEYEKELAAKDAEDDTIPVARRDTDDGADESDKDIAAQHAQALADDDEDYDTIPDGVDEADYLKDLDAKDAEDDSIPVKRREADADADAIFSPSAAERKRLGRMRPHYVNHEERMAADLKQFMKRYADESEDDAEVDISLEGYDHKLVRRQLVEDDEDQEWEEPQEELKGYDHSKLLARENEDELSPEEYDKYLKQWNSVVARDFEDLEDEEAEAEDSEDGNDRYAAPEDTEAGTAEKRGLPTLKTLRKGVKVTEKRRLPTLKKLRKGVKVLLGY